MWLINTTTFQLTFAITGDAKYAILSHTWGEGEVLFQDMANLDLARAKAGWAKIEKTCQLALGEDPPLEYAWVDTCCIDKTSSAELSEAINSMFKWYHSAIICYVHLGDFPDSARDRLPFLRNCRWFTRGWTLQELLASERISFHNQNWEYIGNKWTLGTLLTCITNISSDVLQDVRYLATVPVGVRLSWASKRKTTRVEDIAYSLLGIFNVNMPLLYGEGHRAFMRLQEEIAKASSDATLFAWQQSGSLPAFRGIFALSPLEFVHCADLRVPEDHFALENDFALNNRGVRFEHNLALMPRPSDKPQDSAEEQILILGLDCVDGSSQTNFESKWVGIELQKFDSLYLRVRPNRLFYSSTRTLWRSSGSQKRTANIPRALTWEDLGRVHQRTKINIVYSHALRQIVDERDVPTRNIRVLYVDQPDRIFEVDYHRSPMQTFKHAHWIQIQVECQKIRLVVVYGIDIRRKRGPHEAFKPWVTIFNEKDFVQMGEDSMGHQAIFSVTDLSLSHEEKLARLRDHVFERFVDKSGCVNEDHLAHEISIHCLQTVSASHIVSASVQLSSGPIEDTFRGLDIHFDILLHYNHVGFKC